MTTKITQRMFRAVKRRHVGIVRHCVALGCADIGEAVLDDGRTVWITWGRNVAPDQREGMLAHTTYELALLGSSPKAWGEYILPTGMALDMLMQAVVLDETTRWIEDD